MCYNEIREMSQIIQNKNGGIMKLSEIAIVRTGLVTKRKKAQVYENTEYQYQLLNLKCMSENGVFDFNQTEVFCTTQRLNSAYLTQIGDIIIRLSSPYSVAMIREGKECGFVIPSHFAIIRVDIKRAVPEYVFWALKRDQTKREIIQNMSGSTAFGTISSGFFGNLEIRGLPYDKQLYVGQAMLLSEKEQELILRLVDEKSKYNKALVSKIYDTIKRGK